MFYAACLDIFLWLILFFSSCITVSCSYLNRQQPQMTTNHQQTTTNHQQTNTNSHPSTSNKKSDASFLPTPNNYTYSSVPNKCVCVGGRRRRGGGVQKVGCSPTKASSINMWRRGVLVKGEGPTKIY